MIYIVICDFFEGVNLFLPKFGRFFVRVKAGLESQAQIRPNQNGFVSGRSIQTQLLQHYSNVYEAYFKRSISKRVFVHIKTCHDYHFVGGKKIVHV